MKSYVHNLFVISNSINNIEKYFLDVIGAKKLDLELKNISDNRSFQYYSQEFLGVVILENYYNHQQILFDCELLEILKMYFLLKQIINFDIINSLKEVIDRQKEVEWLLFGGRVPVFTLNAIENMKETKSFKRYKEGIDFKISYLNVLQEREKNKNALLLNILIYILTFIGSIGPLQVLQSELGWSFKICLILLTVIFLGTGLFWFWREKKN